LLKQNRNTMKKILILFVTTLIMGCEKEDFDIIGCECNDGMFISSVMSVNLYKTTPTDTSVCSKTLDLPFGDFSKSHGGFKRFVYSINDINPHLYFNNKIGNNQPQNNQGSNGNVGCSGKRTTSVQCVGNTQSGSRCKNKTLSCNSRCHLHGGN